MTRELRPLLFAALFGAVLWLSWEVFRPFVAGAVWASVLVVTFRPLHDRLERAFRGRAWAASAAVTVLVAAFVVVPLVVAAVQVVQGAVRGYQWAQTAYYDKGPALGAQEKWPWFDDALTRAKELVGMADVDVKAALVNGVKNVGTFVAAKAPAVVGGVAGLIFSFVVMLFLMLVLFASGDRVAAEVERALPLPRDDAARILRDLGLMTRSVFISLGMTALVQAALGWIMLTILGVDGALTLALAMFFVALLPGGTGIVWVPVSIWLAAVGHPWKALILFAWGAGVISTIDNVIRPLFARGGVRLPTVVLTIGMVGGLIAFGIVGLFLGPIVLYLLRELSQVAQRERTGASAESG